jgi:hypothetical protein
LAGASNLFPHQVHALATIRESADLSVLVALKYLAGPGLAFYEENVADLRVQLRSGSSFAGTRQVVALAPIT